MAFGGCRWCGLVAVVGCLAVCPRPADADTVEPRVLLVVDTSGSMAEPAGGSSGTQRMYEAKAALADVFSGVGEVSFALQSFIDRSTCEAPCTCDNAICSAGDLLVPFGSDNDSILHGWVDGTCDYSVPDPELTPRVGGGTPLAANLRAAKDWLTTQVIPNDSAATCRPYIVVVVTDGMENCETCTDAVNAVSSLCDVSIQGRPETGCDVVQTYVVGFDIASSCLDQMAQAGGTGRDSAIFADDRTSLAIAFQEIVAEARLNESCDGEDNDCDGAIDEDFTELGQSCDNGQLGQCRQTGTFVCKADGTGTVCDAPMGSPASESCDGTDEDCDGKVDEGCTDECFPELVNCKDDDCDGKVDEGTTGVLGEPCTPAAAECVTRVWQCDGDTLTCAPSADAGMSVSDGGSGSGLEERCNGLDDDCDGKVDESPLSGAGEQCTESGFSDVGDTGACEFGSTTCVDGEFQCKGYVAPAEETCNALDDDCDGKVDESATCPGDDQRCIAGECAGACLGGEFPCPSGHRCEEVDTSQVSGMYCLQTACFDVDCPSGQRCDEETGECVDPCSGTQCPEGKQCVEGVCVGCNDPRISCGDMEACRQCDTEDGFRCYPDPCASSPCGEGEVCEARFDGDCELAAECRASCAAVECGAGERCVNGQCEPDPCAGVECGEGELCDPERGECVERCDCTSVHCPDGRACSPLSCECVADPCQGTRCPEGSTCRVTRRETARCQVPGAQGEITHIDATGGGGCACRVTEDRSDAAALIPFAVLGLAWLAGRRRVRGKKRGRHE